VRFSYSKIYADLVAPDGTACIVYVARLRAAGFEQENAGYELYRPDGTRLVVHASGPARLEQAPGALDIGFQTARGPFELTSRDEVTSDGALHEPTRGLGWRVVVHRGHAVARELGDAPWTTSGASYADEVVLKKPPRWLGLRRIRWGRAHVGTSSFVFNQLTFASGPAWQAAWQGTRWSTALELQDTASELSSLSIGDAQLTLGAGRPLHVGSALDGERFPGVLARAFARALTGRIEEVRTLSEVTLGERSGALLHEDVRIG